MPRDLTSQERKDKIGNISLNTIKYKAGQWMRNVVMNELKIRESRGVNFLFDKLKDIPCIIVGAGPSLDKNIEVLQECEPKACIMACSSALVPLMEHNVMPHIVFITESKGTSKDSFMSSGVYDKSEDIILICDSFTHPSIWEDWKGEVMFYNIFPSDSFPMTYALSEFTGQIGSIGAGGSVTTVMLILAHKGMKADPIILVGQDCGYYESDKDHAQGAIACRMEERYLPEEVEDISGNPCKTNNALLSFCYFFEDYALSQNATFINATEGGILTNGFSVQNLEYTLHKHLRDTWGRDGIMQILLNPNNIVDAAKPENRWNGIDRDVDKTTTYMPGNYVDRTLSRLHLEDFMEGFGYSRNVYPSFITPEHYRKVMLGLVDMIISNYDPIPSVACHDKEYKEDMKYDCVYSIDLVAKCLNQQDLLALLFEMNKYLSSSGILIAFHDNKQLLLSLYQLFKDVSIMGLKFNVECTPQFAEIGIPDESQDSISLGDVLHGRSLIINSKVSANIDQDGDYYCAIIKMEDNNESQDNRDNSS